jgi:hypothetical protein
LIPAAPADLVGALGAFERRLYVVPSRKLVVVRTGAAANDPDLRPAAVAAADESARLIAATARSTTTSFEPKGGPDGDVIASRRWAR